VFICPPIPVGAFVRLKNHSFVTIVYPVKIMK
jgi:hypothetical protein